MFNESKNFPCARTPEGRKWERVRLALMTGIVVLFAGLTAFGLWIHIFPLSDDCSPSVHLGLSVVTMVINICIFVTSVFYWVKCICIYQKSGKIISRRLIRNKRDCEEGKNATRLTRMGDSDEKESLLRSRGSYKSDKLI